jgi:hypothetical protein
MPGTQFELTESTLINRLETLKNEVGTLGAAYKPPNAFAAVAALETNLAEAKTLRAVLLQKDAEEEEKRNRREELFAPLASLCGELATYCESALWSANDVANLRALVREMRGKRAQAVKPPVEGEPPPKSISTAQTSFVSRADHFAQFIEILRAHADNFKPEEDKYKLTTLEAFLNELRDANSAVAAAETASSQARTALDAALYTSPANLVDAAKSEKKYAGSAFKTTQVNQNIKGLKFEKPRRL